MVLNNLLTLLEHELSPLMVWEVLIRSFRAHLSAQCGFWNQSPWEGLHFIPLLSCPWWWAQIWCGLTPLPTTWCLCEFSSVDERVASKHLGMGKWALTVVCTYTLTGRLKHSALLLVEGILQGPSQSHYGEAESRDVGGGPFIMGAPGMDEICNVFLKALESRCCWSVLVDTPLHCVDIGAVPPDTCHCPVIYSSHYSSL